VDACLVVDKAFNFSIRSAAGHVLIVSICEHDLDKYGSELSVQADNFSQDR
jgi:hypothetical protein